MGFFTRQTAKEARAAKRGGRGTIPTSALVALGASGAKGMNPKALSPDMAPSGSTEPSVYVLGGYPGEEDDSARTPYASEVGEMLWDAMPGWAHGSVRYGYCVPTLPPFTNKGRRKPTAGEIACFRKQVVDDIMKSAPKVILGLGNIVLKWLTGLTSIKAARGKLFSVCIGGHVCWYMPTLTPEHLIHIEGRRDDKVPAQEWFRFWEKDIGEAFDAVDAEVPQIVGEEEARAGVVHCLTVGDVRRAVVKLLESKELGFDIETHRLRPYFHDSRLLSVAFSDGETTYSIPIDHPQSPWKRSERRSVLQLLCELFDASGVVLVAHNLPFDLEWMEHLIPGVLDGEFGCSMQAAFALDPGPPPSPSGGGTAGHALDDLCLQHFGLGLKALSPGAQWVTRLRELPLDKVLAYNALDAKWCLRLWKRLMVLVDKKKVCKSYELQMSRIPAILYAQKVGIPVDQKVREGLGAEIANDVQKIDAQIQADPDVAKFVKQHGVFRPTSSKDVGALFGDTLGVLTTTTATGQYATGAPVLEKFKDEHPVLALILKSRQTSKLLSTYVTRFDPTADDTYVGKDGRVHCQFTIAKARTGRLASQEPNNQNWPKRKNKHVQRQLQAPKGWVWIAADQGQIEARVLAMESQDPRWVHALTEGLDIHQEWAERIAMVSPNFDRLLHDDPKEARSKSKNGWVFPAFYGSSIKSITAALELDEEVADELFAQFWREFAKVKRWQQRQWAGYEDKGFVRGLTGRVRLGPLSYNMVINTPIQGVASDICVDALIRLYDRSVEEKLPWLAPVMQVHDDLKQLVPESEAGYAIQAMVEEQLGFDAYWVNVPLTVEVEMGTNLAEMESVGVWSSQDFEA